MSDKKRVLVLCTGNSARSQMLEAILNDKLGDRVVATSAGTKPAAEVHPLAIRALEEIGIAPAGASPQSVTDVADQEFDVAMTVCDSARESCPALPGAPRTIHIGYPDPAAARGSQEERLVAFRAVRDSMASWADFCRIIVC